ncbi:MAG: hypothetical protein U0R19_37650 [Bryobacteraceae bacterium]
MNIRRWLNWQPREQISCESAHSEPTKPAEPGFDGFVGPAAEELAEIHPLEEVLKGRAVELYLADGDRLFIVADEEDAQILGEPRGAVYTAAEVRQVIQIADAVVVREVHEWKRRFNARVREYQPWNSPTYTQRNAAGEGEE